MDSIKEAENKIAAAHGECQAISMRRLYHLADKMVTREKYKNVTGMDAIYYYLIQKHNWLPSQVKTMNTEDMMLCLEEEEF